MARTSAAKGLVVEKCWVLLGPHRGRIWYCRRARHTSGERSSVLFDGAWVLGREEKYRDVVGFLHSHPEGPAAPSQRDVRTMRAWCSSFGKPLLCVIAALGALHGYRFDDDESVGKPLSLVEMFALRGGVVIGVDGDGG